MYQNTISLDLELLAMIFECWCISLYKINKIYCISFLNNVFFFFNFNLRVKNFQRMRLMSLAAQKFVADIATDAFQYCKIRQQSKKNVGKVFKVECFRKKSQILKISQHKKLKFKNFFIAT